MSIKKIGFTRTKHLGMTICLGLMLSACGGGGGDGGTSATADPDADQAMFERLSAVCPECVEEGPSTQSVNYHPLRKKVSSFKPRHEIILPGFNVAGSTRDLPIIEHKTATHPSQGENKLCNLSDPEILDGTIPVPTGCKQEFSEMSLQEDGDSWWENDLTTSFSADLDGNGVNEIVNIYIDQSGDVIANIITCTAPCDVESVETGPVGATQPAVTGDGGSYEMQYITLLASNMYTRQPQDDGLNYNGYMSPSKALDWFRAGIIAADVDGDGKDEIVSVAFDNLDVFDASKDGSGFQFVREAKDLPLYSGRVLPQMSIASGRFLDRDIDDQERDDIVIAASELNVSELYFYDDPVPGTDANSAPFNETNLDEPRLQESLYSMEFRDGLTFTYHMAFVGAGDIDNDGTDEIVINALRATTYTYDALVFDTVKSGATDVYQLFSPIRLHLGTGLDFDWASGGVWSPVVKVFWPNGRGEDAALYVGSHVFEGVAQLIRTERNVGSPLPGLNAGISVSYMNRNNGASCFICKYYLRPKTVTVADVYGTGKESIVAVWGNSTTGTVERIVQDTNTNWVWDKIADGENTASDPENALITAANIDLDSPIVKFVGKSLKFTKPKIIAALAVPPFYSGPNGNNSGNSTTFEQGAASGSSSAETMGHTAGFSLGYETPDNALGVPLPQFEVEFMFDRAVDNTTKEAQSTTIGSAISTSASQKDLVIYTVIPMDVYWYTNPASSDQSATLSIDVPRPYETHSLTLAAYNEMAGVENGIDGEIFPHTVGEPSTYFTADEQAQLCNPVDVLCISNSGGPFVDANGGDVNDFISVDSSVERIFTEDINLGVEITNKWPGGFKASARAGFHTGVETATTTSKFFEYSGLVTGIPAQPAGSNISSYNFGIFVYDTNFSNRENFRVINYWIQ